jgi:alkylhydroperoxidase/carboxymuconolactone decarboxylase family protein YurZ
MGGASRFEEILLKLAIFDEALIEEMAGRGLVGESALGSKTAALLQIAVSVATGSSQVCLQWSTARALAAGASKDEIADVLLAIAPVAGLGRVVSAAPGVAAALDYDIDAALEAPDGY